MTPRAAADFYLELGLPVLPIWPIRNGRCACGEECSSPGKHPLSDLVRNGLKGASLDHAAIDRWWQRWPDANLAIATGSSADCFVVDVDGPTGDHALAQLERQHGAMPDLYPMQWTGGGRGGWQGFLAWPEGRDIRNRKLGPKLETRGEGGYVLVPPSITVEPYRWADDRDPWSIPPEPAPDWLVDLLDPPKVDRPDIASIDATSQAAAGDRNLRIFADQIKLVAWAPDGERNDQLFSSALTLFWMVDAGRLTKNGVYDALKDAAEKSGLHTIEVQRTLASAARRRGVSL